MFFLFLNLPSKFMLTLEYQLSLSSMTFIYKIFTSRFLYLHSIYFDVVTEENIMLLGREWKERRKYNVKNKGELHFGSYIKFFIKFLFSILISL